MSKERHSNKEAKKPAQHTLKEKRAARHARKMQGFELHPPITTPH